MESAGDSRLRGVPCIGLLSIVFLMHENIDVILPNLKRRLSGVTATLVRLLPIQVQSMNIAAVGPGLPSNLPKMPLWSLLLMGGKKTRVWHARRNTEMLLGLLLREVFRKNLKLVFTSASQRHHTRYTRFLISRMDAVIATSRKSASYLKCPARTILHGIDTRKFCPAVDKSVVRRSLNIPDDGMLIGCYGRIRHQKGTDVFVDAMIDMLPEFPDVAALVMGRATSKHQAFLNDLRQRVKEARLEDRILFLPESPVDQMPGWYQVLDLFVAPQRWEGFGLTPLESMACGVPVIATDVGAFDELIEEGKTGMIIRPGDKEHLFRAVHSMIVSPQKIQSWSMYCRQRMELHFSIENEADSLNALYRNLLSEGTVAI